ncbi:MULTISPECIES: hypothetical protein [Pantoea]|uniref:hypothetical protein n=1 Tax=Pantoea TaxID=53335 RepID=UPI001B30D7F2|nr:MULTISPECIES: hypothetical protein [Pantoea]MCH9299889.1 hypothetical protein [Pantoea allii]MDJ0042570.1 hypothetical protein [Pantoea allii]
MLRSKKIKRIFSDGDPRPVSKYILIRNIFILYLILCFFVFFCFELIKVDSYYDYSFSLSHLFESVPYAIASYIFIIFSIAIHFRWQVKNNTINNKKFTTERSKQPLYDSSCSSEKIFGRNIGIKLTADINPCEYKFWTAELIDYVIKEGCTKNDPLIFRSHFLSLKKIRAYVISELLKNHMICSVRTDLSLKNPFILKWYMPAMIALRLKLPALRDREAEIVIRPTEQC